MTTALFDITTAAQVAEGAARAAGAVIRHAYSLPRRTRDKGVNDLVTETDFASETLIVNSLRLVYPYPNLTAEEAGAHVNFAQDAPTW